MPRYVVERSHPERLRPRASTAGGDPWAELIATNAEQGVTWIHSYVVADFSKSFCICDAPTPEAVRAAARLTNLTIDRITEVRVLDPYLPS